MRRPERDRFGSFTSAITTLCRQRLLEQKTKQWREGVFTLKNEWLNLKKWMFKQVFVKEMKPSLQHDAGSCIIWEGCGTHHWRYHSPTVRRWCTTNPNNRTTTLSVFFPQKISGEETKFQLRMCNYHQVESSHYGRCNTTHLHLLLKEKNK